MNLAKLHFVRYEIGDDPYGITLGSAIGNLLMAERITPIHSKYDVWRALGQHYEGIGDLHSASKAYTCGLKQVSNNINNYDIEVQKQYGMQNAADWFINKLHQL